MTPTEKGRALWWLARRLPSQMSSLQQVCVRPCSELWTRQLGFNL